MSSKKKLIEVALPLEEINIESAREKSIRHGHPSTIHLWWARRPLATCRAVLFAQLVDDPDQPGLSNEYLNLVDALELDKFKAQAANKPLGEVRRLKLFELIAKFVKWDNLNNIKIFDQARGLIKACCGESVPAIYDPFSGGGSIPLEGQRLGLPAFGTDLNPVACAIGKGLIEIPPRFSSSRPINPEYKTQAKQQKIVKSEFKGANGLAEDLSYYGKVLRESAHAKIGHLHPKVSGPDGQSCSVICWIWARTVASPNPALSKKVNGRVEKIYVPLVTTLMLSAKEGKEAWLEPIIDGQNYRFEVRHGKPPKERRDEVDNGTKSARGANFKCLLSGVPITPEYIKAEGTAGRLGATLIAVVADNKGRLYLPGNNALEELAQSQEPDWIPDEPLPNDPRNFWTLNYGLTTFGHLFTRRQLVTLTTLCDQVSVVREEALKDAIAAGMKDDGIRLSDGGSGAVAYADAIAVYLAFAIDKLADYGSSICSWNVPRENIRSTFGRQAIPMAWDFAEVNPFSESSGNLTACIDWVCRALETTPANGFGYSGLCDASAKLLNSVERVVSTDPPYYDNVAYADLSDFFYIWLRRSLKGILPELFKTVMTPKDKELVASPYRHGGKDKAEQFFLEGMTNALKNIHDKHEADYPVTIYYAFKQSETKAGGVSSTGWETFLEAVIRAGFSICGTWPMRTERGGRMISLGTNALASSIVLVCRRALVGAGIITRGDFIKLLKKELPGALQNLQHSNIAPVDLAQASIGPGMSIFTRFEKVMEADGSAMAIKPALQLINESLDDYMSEQEGEYDIYSRFAITWFEQFGMQEGDYGIAETLAKARNVSVQGAVESGIALSKAGKVRLRTRTELDADWDPAKDKILTVWESTHYLIREHETGGERAAAVLLNKLTSIGDRARDLAYRLYSMCERKKWTDEALAYNALVVAWPYISELAAEIKQSTPQLPEQLTLQV